MLCRVTRSQRMRECETHRRPTRISRAIWAAQKSTMPVVEHELGATHLKLCQFIYTPCPPARARQYTMSSSSSGLDDKKQVLEMDEMYNGAQM